MVLYNIIPLIASFWLVYKCFKLFFPCKAIVSSVISINVNFVTVHEIGNSCAKIIKNFQGKESLEHLSSTS